MMKKEILAFVVALVAFPTVCFSQTSPDGSKIAAPTNNRLTDASGNVWGFAGSDPAFPLDYYVTMNGQMVHAQGLPAGIFWSLSELLILNNGQLYGTDDFYGTGPYQWNGATFIEIPSLPSGGTPSITVNGAGGGTTVTAGGSMSVAVANGPGNPTDWMGACNAGVPISSTQCDGAGLSWDYLNCTHTAPTAGVTSATCSLSAPLVAGHYSAVFFSNNTYSVLATAPFGVTAAPTSPSITVNGTSSGTTVSAGSSITVAVSNGPGNPTDRMALCNSATPTSANCEGAGLPWYYLNCTDGPIPSPGVPSGSCTMDSPLSNGNYYAFFLANGGYTVLASAPLTVVGSNIPPSVQALATSIVPSSGTQCVWTVPQAVAAGNTVMGFVHSSNAPDTQENYPTSVTDNVGNTYNLTAGVHWVPWAEDIGMWYLTNVRGCPNTFTFSGFPVSPPSCNVGFVEYAGVSNITLALPRLDGTTSPSLTISPSAPSWIWAFAADFRGGQNSLQNSGYGLLIDNINADDIGVWGSLAQVPAGSLTLRWNAPLGPPGACDGIPSGCPTVIMAAALH